LSWCRLLTQIAWKHWTYCYGLKSENISIWQHIWNKWKQTYDVTYLKYIACSEDTQLIIDYLSLMREDKFFQNVSHINTILDIFFHIITQHAEKNAVWDIILRHLNIYLSLYSADNK